MARINIVSDYAVPAGVGLVEMGLKAWDRDRLGKNPEAMEFEPLAPYALAVLGTGARMFDVLPRQDNNLKMAIAASMPRVITGIYDWATSAVGVARTGRTRAVRLPVRTTVRDEALPSRGQGGYRF